ncbi:MAG TPA: non-heme iron oxygenase ferredoxin subunit [Anaerolineae bacterium]|nr:non-heme iron oxygenase ferredoxin subunit [Anaerolineae bacterium]
MRIVVITDDPVVLRGIERVGETLGAALDCFKSLAAATFDDAPSAIVLDAEVARARETVGELKSRWPQTLVAGFVSNPSRTLWEQAEAAGFDLVASRGALAAQLNKKLKDWQAASGKRQVRVCDMADLAGRLGVVARLGDLLVGPVAVYHFSGKVYAAADVCPHAGARLSEGALEGTVITCPLHGSQFDVRTGERLRGPADVEIKTYRVEIQGTQVFLVL